MYMCFKKKINESSKTRSSHTDLQSNYHSNPYLLVIYNYHKLPKTYEIGIILYTNPLIVIVEGHSFYFDSSVKSTQTLII